MTRRQYSNVLLTCAIMAVVAASPSLASVPYQPSTTDAHRFIATCLGERVDVSYTVRGADRAQGLNAIAIDGRPVPPDQLAKAMARLNGQPLARVEFLGCRRTREGDVRHWLLLSPAITPTNADDPGRVKSFYIRRGQVEIHQRQPVD